jgi:murein DD-endopeptidase MepM/ murein hydrolase activator NlpD
VIRRFQPPARPYGPGHRGVDLAGVAGQPVLAAGDGLVQFAGQVGGRGVVSIEHSGGLRTTYEPVAATVLAGRRVRRGEVIGSLVPGHGHPDDRTPDYTPTSAPAVCLHWGARRGHEYLDPLPLLNLATVRLLPWTAG